MWQTLNKVKDKHKLEICTSNPRLQAIFKIPPSKEKGKRKLQLEDIIKKAEMVFYGHPTSRTTKPFAAATNGSIRIGERNSHELKL